MREGGGAGGRPAPEEEAPGMAPVRAFLMLVAVAVVVPVTILATRPEAAPTKPPAQATPDFSLTDPEAIAEFERLKHLLAQAYRSRDVTLIDQFASSDPGDGVQQVAEEIQTLIRDQVLYRTREKRESLQVVVNTSDRIELREVVVKAPRFIDEADRENIALDERPQRQTIIWQLRLEGDRWRIHSGVITASVQIGRQRS
jgi:hypothetical protein